MTIEQLLKNLLNIHKIPFRTILLIFIPSLILHLIPIEYLRIINMDNIQIKHKETIGIAFIFTSTYIAIAIFYIISNKVSKWYVAKKRKKSKIIKEANMMLKLESLSLEEQIVLREFHLTNKTSIIVPSDKVIHELIECGILDFNKRVRTGKGRIVFLSKFSRNNLKDEHVGWRHDITDEEFEIYKSQRPVWAEI